MKYSNMRHELNMKPVKTKHRKGTWAGLTGTIHPFQQTGTDLYTLFRSKHTKDTLHRGKQEAPREYHTLNLFSNDHHGGGIGAIRRVTGSAK